MPLWPNIIGGAYKSRSVAIAADTLINLYLEMTEAQAEVKQAALYGTSGLKPLLTVGAASCRGCFQEDGRSFAVVATQLVEFDFTLNTATVRGTVANDGLPVTFDSNGRGGEQLAVCSAGKLYIFSYTANTLTGPIGLPMAGVPVMVDFVDGYFLLLEKSTPKVWFSALEDGTSWSGLDFFARSETSDNLIGIKVLNNRIWCFGSQTSEIYYNTGDATNPFSPFPGTVMQEGLVCYSAVVISGESLAWLAQDSNGRNWISIASSPQPNVISTPAISVSLDGYAETDDCEAMAFEEAGHPCIAFTFPTPGITWIYDELSKVWRQQQGWDSAAGAYVRWRARGICSVGQQIIMGDYATGTIYAFDLETYTDNGGTVMRERTAPYIGTDNQLLFLDQFELGMEAGVGLVSGQGVDPKLMLEVSWDGAKTWGPTTVASIGAIGAYGASASWHQLGSGRQDRLVVRIRQSDPVKAVWGPGAWVRATPGTGQR